MQTQPLIVPKGQNWLETERQFVQGLALNSNFCRSQTADCAVNVIVWLSFYGKCHSVWERYNFFIIPKQAILSATMCNSPVIIAYQPKQQPIALRHLDVAKRTCCSIRMGRKEDWSCLERGTVVGARWSTSPSVCQSTYDLLGFSYWHKYLLGFYRKLPSEGENIEWTVVACWKMHWCQGSAKIGKTGWRPRTGNSNSLHHWLQPRPGE